MDHSRGSAKRGNEEEKADITAKEWTVGANEYEENIVRIDLVISLETDPGASLGDMRVLRPSEIRIALYYVRR
jgi:hypothetical protein